MKSPATMIAAFLLAFSTGISGQETVSQKDPFAFAKEGENIQLNCSYQGTPNNLQWYNQTPDGQIHFMAILYSTKTESFGRFDMSLQKEKRTTSLLLKKIQLHDSVVYFCAMSNTGSGWGKITFGSGTKLLVLPNLEHSPPSIYELRPDASAVREKKDKAACLFTDYFPNPLKVKSKEGEKEVEVNGSVVVVKEEDAEKGTGSYGIVLWGDKDDNFHCAASDKNGKKFVSDTADDPGTCIAESGDNETGIRLNLLSLTVLGLRVVFLKSVAFNLLLTFRLWSRRG